MKTRLCVLLAIFGFQFSSSAQTKHALIFAIGNYDHWPKISSLHDVSFIDTLLTRQDFKDIRIITDQDASMSGICNALNDLINKVNPGDVVVIHFSSHGEQVQDDDRNRDETDGLDESIVTYDAKLPPHRDSQLSRDKYDEF